MRATEDTPPFVRLVCSSPCAARRFLGIATSAPPGEPPSRESLTQDSRSPVKARPLRSVTRIIRRGALRSSRQKTWRPRQRPSRGFEPSITRGNAARWQRRCLCARTSLAVAPLVTTRAGSTVHARYGRTACHWRARGPLQTSGARVTRGMHRTLAASSRWGSDEGRRRLRCSAGAGRLGAALDRDWERGDHRHEQNDDAPREARRRAAPARSSLHRTFRSAFGAESVRRCGRFQRP